MSMLSPEEQKQLIDHSRTFTKNLTDLVILFSNKIVYNQGNIWYNVMGDRNEAIPNKRRRIPKHTGSRESDEGKECESTAEDIDDAV